MATAAVTVNTSFIAASYSFPEYQLDALLEAPTVDLVKSLLTQIEIKAREYQTKDADKLRTDVELDTVIRSSENRVRQLKDSVDKGSKEIESLQQKLSQEGAHVWSCSPQQDFTVNTIVENARLTAESELHKLKLSNSSSTVEIQNLKSRIDILEASNRDAVALLQTKSSSSDTLSEELSTQHQKVAVLRKEVDEQREKLQAAETESITTAFRVQALQQELEAVKKNSQWYEDELKQSNEAHSKYRHEKSARLAELQSQYEDAIQQVETLRRTESTLRNQVSELERKADDARTRTLTVQEEAAKKELDLQNDIQALRRLGDLLKTSADRNKARLDDILVELEQTKNDAAEEIGQLQAEIDTEHSLRETAEAQVIELEAQISRLVGDTSVLERGATIPLTPRRTLNVLASRRTPGQLGSPIRASSPASSRLSFDRPTTPVADEPNELKAQLASATKKNIKLKVALEDAIRQLDTKEPHIDRLQLENDRLTAEKRVLERSSREAIIERDRFRKDARKWEGQVSGLSREAELLRQQIRDLGLQLKIIIMETQAREQGLGELSAVDQSRIEHALKEELNEAQLAGLSSTNQYITERLVIFRNVSELQAQNQQLLYVSRKLGEELESEEAKANRNELGRTQTELQDLREKYAALTDEVKVVVEKSQSYIRERDMFRSLISQNRNISLEPEAGSVLEHQSHLGSSALGTPNMEIEAARKEAEERHTELIQQLNQLENEKDELAKAKNGLEREKMELEVQKKTVEAELSLTKGRLEMAAERNNSLQSKFDALKAEHVSLQDRLQSISESMKKQEEQTQQSILELTKTKSTIETQQAEIMGLRTERETWKASHDRAQEDYHSVVDERLHLTKMLKDQQTNFNVLQLREAEDRRELQTRVEKLKNQLEAAQLKLQQEIEESRQAAREQKIKEEQTRARIDDQTTVISNLREEIAPVKAERDRLQSRLDELQVELRTAQEKVRSLQRRENAREGYLSDTDDEAEDVEDLEGKVLELQDEIKSRDRIIGYTQNDLDTANRKIQESEAAASSAQQDLQTMNESYDEYRGQIERILAEKDDKISDLQKRVDEASSELQKANNDLSELRVKHEETESSFNSQKIQLEAELTRTRDEKERWEETAQLRGEDVKAQAEIAQQAQQDYEQELAKHTETLNTLHAIRSDFNSLQTEATEYKYQAMSAKDTLEEQQESWALTKSRLEKDVVDMRVRRAEVLDQNQVLHSQLEEFSKQIVMLTNNRPLATVSDESTEASPSKTTKNYQDMVNYLKREKEIVELQRHDAASQLSTTKSKLQFTEQKLEATEEKLRKITSKEVTLQEHNEAYTMLMEKIKELNVIRESNVTLRNDSQRYREKLEESEKEVEQLRNQLEPLQARMIEVEADLEYKSGLVKLVEEDRDRWQKRSDEIMHKYQRIDPADLEALHNQISSLQAERDQLITDKQNLQQQVDAVGERIREAKEEATKEFEERRAKLMETAKERDRVRNNTIREKTADLERVTAEKVQLTTELTSVRAELETTKAARDEALAKAQSTNDSVDANAKAGADTLEEGQVLDNESSQTIAAEKESLQAQLAEAKKSADEQSARGNEFASQIQSLQQRVQELQARVQELEGQTTSLQDLIKQKDEELAVLKITSLTTGTRDTSAEPSKDQLQDGGADDPTLQNKALEEAREDFKKRVDNMRTQLNQKLRESRDKIRGEVAEQHAAEIQRLQQEHENNVNRLQEEHKAELERIRNQAPTTTEPAEAAQSQPSTSVTTQDPVDPAILSGEKELTQENARSLIEHQPGFKAMITKNITKRLEQERETIKTQLREEESKSITQLKEDVEKAKRETENVKTLMEKKFAARLSMANNSKNAAQAKIDVVKQAATETPQRPVVEVWEIAEKTKPLPQQAAAAPVRPPQAPVSTPQASTATIQPPNAAAVAPPAVPAAQTPPQQAQRPVATAVSSLPQPPTQALPNTVPPANNVATADPKPSNETPQGATQQRHLNPMQELRPLGSGTSTQPPIQNQGTGPGALRNLIAQQGPSGQQGNQSGIPRPGQQRGRNVGRGGFQNQGQYPQQQVQQQPQAPPAPATANTRGGPQGAARGTSECEPFLCAKHNAYYCHFCAVRRAAHAAEHSAHDPDCSICCGVATFLDTTLTGFLDGPRGRGRGAPSGIPQGPGAPGAGAAAGRGAGRGALNPAAGAFNPAGPAAAANAAPPGAAGPAAGTAAAAGAAADANNKRKSDDSPGGQSPVKKPKGEE